MTFRHRAGVSPYTSPFGFAETCVFDKQLPGPILCGSSCEVHSFFRSYGVNLPSSLTTLLPLALEFSSHLPVSVCGTGALKIHIPFLAPTPLHFPTIFRSLSPHATIGGDATLSGVSILNFLAATEFLPYVHRLRLSASP